MTMLAIGHLPTPTPPLAGRNGADKSLTMRPPKAVFPKWPNRELGRAV